MKITAGNINKALSRIRAAGLDPFTDLKMVQQANPRLVRAHGRAQSGRIMSYNESVKVQLAAQAKNPDIRIWTKEEYKQALAEFYEEHKTRLTVTGAKEDFYNRAYDVLERADAGIDYVELRRIPVDEIRDMFNKANDYAEKFKDSWAFYEFLSDQIENYLEVKNMRE